MLNEGEKEQFRIWLKKHTHLLDKSISDTVCRIGRIDTLSKIQTNLPVDDFLFKLTKNLQFSRLTPSVKSQLRKAYKLYHAFRTA
jgi:hypothetical protein